MKILLLVGVVGLSATISYAWWVKLRVWLLRRDLFSIREKLWKEMYEQGLLDAPEYFDARESINAMIHSASMLSFYMVATIYKEVSRAADPDLLEDSPVSSIPEVAAASEDLDTAVCRYLRWYTLTGLLHIDRLIFHRLTTERTRCASNSCEPVEFMARRIRSSASARELLEMLPAGCA